jgi:apolipoprotein N-acyltransferase
MAFATDNRRIGAALLAVTFTAVLVWFGNGLNPWWELLWFAPLPVLLFSLRSSWWAAALTAALASLIGSLNLWHYFRVLHAAPSVWLLIFSVSALMFAAAVSLFRALLLRGASWSALLAFPATWVSYEYVRNLTTPHGTAGSFAYSQLRFLPFLQLASVTGPWGMSFLLLLFPAALAVGLYLRHTAPKQALRIVGASLGVIALVLIFGAVRLALPSPRQQVKVGLIASDEPVNDHVADEGAETDRLLHDYAGEAEKLAAAGAQVIVLPEKLGVVVDPNTKTADAIFQSLADQTRSTIVVGLLHVSPLPPQGALKYNEARVYAPKASVLSYDKHHMLPPFESPLTPGTTLTLIPTASETWGVAICKDMDFAPLSRQYGEAGAGLMLVPGWDFNVDRSWHGHIAMMRGVESGFSVAHAAKNGYLTVSDDRGRILAESRSDSAPFATLIANAPVAHDATLYLLMGDWFAWLALATLVFTLAQLYRSKNPLT